MLARERSYPQAIAISPREASRGISASAVRGPNTFAILSRMRCPPWVDNAFVRVPVPVCAAIHAVGTTVDGNAVKTYQQVMP